MGIKYDKLAFIAWFTPVSGGWGLPLLWTGSPGLAKTAKNKGWAKHFLSPFLHLSPGQKGDGYFGVVPVPYTNKHGRDVLKFPINDDIDRLIEVGHGLILADELRSAPGIVRPALLGLFQERVFGDEQLPVGIRVWAASNATKGIWTPDQFKALVPATSYAVVHRDAMYWWFPDAPEGTPKNYVIEPTASGGVLVTTHDETCVAACADAPSGNLYFVREGE